MDPVKDCHLCQHYARAQIGPNAWDHRCRLGQRAFLDAANCSFYQPPAIPEDRALSGAGLGYVWDGEYEGAS